MVFIALKVGISREVHIEDNTHKKINGSGTITDLQPPKHEPDYLEQPPLPPSSPTTAHRRPDIPHKFGGQLFLMNAGENGDNTSTDDSNGTDDNSKDDNKKLKKDLIKKSKKGSENWIDKLNPQKNNDVLPVKFKEASQNNF